MKVTLCLGYWKMHKKTSIRQIYNRRLKEVGISTSSIDIMNFVLIISGIGCIVSFAITLNSFLLIFALLFFSTCVFNHMLLMKFYTDHDVGAWNRKIYWSRGFEFKIKNQNDYFKAKETLNECEIDKNHYKIMYNESILFKNEDDYIQFILSF